MGKELIELLIDNAMDVYKNYDNKEIALPELRRLIARLHSMEIKPVKGHPGSK